MFAPPSDLNSNSVMVLTENRDLFLFGPDRDEIKEKEFANMVQVKQWNLQL